MAVSWGGVLLQKGEALALDPHYFSIQESVRPENLGIEYYEEAAKRNTFRAPTSSLLDTAFYCSWNYGIGGNVTEESLLKTATAISQNLPNVKFFLLDDGWQGKEEVSSPDCANFYLPEAQWIQNEKFPNGMKAYADKVRALGLRPAIWWTPSVNLSSSLAKAHPEWLARDTKGGIFRIAGSGFLDLGNPDARGYLLNVWDILFKDWGFEALKIDFMTQAFASDSIRYSGGSTLKWRHWFLSTLRAYLPDDGFLMTCVAATQGNIFFGEYAESYRSCIDVGSGTWRRHIDACCWIQPLLAIPGNKTCLQNADGFGINPDVPDHETLHRLTYGFINMGSLEIDGRIEELTPRHLDWLQRLSAHVDRGHVVHCPDDTVVTGSPLPTVLYVDYPSGSTTRKRGVVKHIAFFNWTDEDQFVGATGDQLGLAGPTEARDFWTDETVAIGREGFCQRLAARSARLLELSE